MSITGGCLISSQHRSSFLLMDVKLDRKYIKYQNIKVPPVPAQLNKGPGFGFMQGCIWMSSPCYLLCVCQSDKK